jgi:hypothetical protein
MDPLNVVSQNFAVYKNVFTSLNESLLYIIRCLIQFTVHSYHLGGKKRCVPTIIYLYSNNVNMKVNEAAKS